MRFLRLYCLLFLLAVALPAYALRPFDGTDAVVADAGEFELEFGPLTRLREDGQQTWLAPVLAANWGMRGERELVLEGKRRSSDGSLFDAALSLKQLHRRGVLQDQAGASVASECGLLMPGVRADHGAGASCALIVSQRWWNVTAHFNSALAFSREHRWSPSFGAILELRARSNIRPVVEVLTQKENRESPANSVLAGLIWKRSESFSVDFGIKRMRSGGSNSNELRLGLTWTNSPG